MAPIRLRTRRGAACASTPTPQWFRDAKFGIYTHWGVYSVPGFGSSGAASNATWYPHRMYVDGSPHQKHHLDTYGAAGSVRLQGLRAPVHGAEVRPGRVGGAVQGRRCALRRPGGRASRRVLPVGDRSDRVACRAAGAEARRRRRTGAFDPRYRDAIHGRTAPRRALVVLSALAVPTTTPAHRTRRASTASRTIWSSPTACRKWNSSARPAT